MSKKADIAVLAVLLLIALSGCINQPGNYAPPDHPTPTGFERNSEDDNGVRPPPNNGSENFGSARH